MKTHAFDKDIHPARAEREDGRLLKKNWFIFLVALWVAIWMFVGASGLMPRWLWATILATMVVAGFSIALFGPRASNTRDR